MQKKKVTALVSILLLSVILAGCGLEQVFEYQMAKEDDVIESITSEDFECSEYSSISYQDVNSEEVWQRFLVSEEYKNYISGEYDMAYIEYTLYDINNDGILELILENTAEAPFYNTWLLGLEGTEIKAVYECYGYGQFRYSPSQNAVIVSPEWKPFSGTGYTPFYKLENMELVYTFQVGEDDGQSYYSDNSGMKNISTDERMAYFTDIVNFDWKKISE